MKKTLFSSLKSGADCAALASIVFLCDYVRSPSSFAAWNAWVYGWVSFLLFLLWRFFKKNHPCYEIPMYIFVIVGAGCAFVLVLSWLFFLK